MSILFSCQLIDCLTLCIDHIAQHLRATCTGHSNKQYVISFEQGYVLTVFFNGKTHLQFLLQSCATTIQWPTSNTFYNIVQLQSSQHLCNSFCNNMQLQSSDLHQTLSATTCNYNSITYFKLVLQQYATVIQWATSKSFCNNMQL